MKVKLFKIPIALLVFVVHLLSLSQTQEITRAFQDDSGESVTIPVTPQRVVALDDRTIEAVLAVGGSLVGAVGRYPDQIVPSDFEHLMTGVENIGIQPNIETIARLEPDLIIGQSWIFEGIGEELRQIAPVVKLDYWTDDTYTVIQWEEHFRRVADAVGRTERAEEELERLENAIKAFRTDFPGDVASTELSVIQLQRDQWFYFTPLSLPGKIVEHIGFARPAAQHNSETDRVYLSHELLSVADGDVIITTLDRKENSDGLAGLTSGQLWQSLEAVQAGNVYFVDGFLWLVAGSVPGALAILDDLRQAFDMPPRAE
jgi:iron complex transport system substrate-binding protein